MKVEINQEYGLLKVLAVVRVNNRTLCDCLCACGNKTRVRSDHMKKGVTTSCGCERKRISTERFTTHGERRSFIYKLWSDIKERTGNKNNPRYGDYGGRNITIHYSWRNSYTEFRDYVKALPNCPTGSKQGLTLDRIDNDKSYAPGNLRWATAEVQANNKRTTFYIPVKGKIYPFAVAVRKFGKAGYHTIYCRIKKGWDVEKALFTP